MAVELHNRAALREPRFIVGGLAGIAGAALIASFLPDFISDLVAESRVHHRSAADVPAHIAHALAGSAFAAFFIALAAWLLARSLRLACGLPRRAPTVRRHVLFAVQLFVGAVVLCSLFAADLSEYALRNDEHAVLEICMTGFVGCLLFAYDVPRLVANARRALQARRRFALPCTPLDALPPRGLVHTEGVAVVAVDFAERGSFMVERRAGAATVEIDPNRVSVIVTADDDDAQAAARWPAGTPMRIVAAVERDGGADAIYRGAPPRLVAPADGPLRVNVGEAAALRRLLLAAAVEIVAAIGLGLSVVWFVGTIAFIELALRR